MPRKRIAGRKPADDGKEPRAVASKTEGRRKRHLRIRKTVRGAAARPRLCVFRSAGHIYAQVINDAEGRTLAQASTLDKDLAAHTGHRGNVAAAKAVGALVGRRALESGIKKVVFDRGGYLYHGRIKALAEAARESGLEF
jgi:large subunit ribosomal protein L18